MILKELNLIGFGKFENEKLNLEKGINLIYGENEMGKSTIHSFIDGMFYGFLRPNVRTALYTDEHKKHDPWNTNRYAGMLIFEQNQEEYRIEREFSKGKESTRVFEEGIGSEITKSIDTGNGRILQPGLHFFGFNTSVFSNTIFIKQLQTATDNKLAKEVTEKLINVTTALDEEISVDKAILDLKSKADEIGTERAPTKPYARNIKRIADLKDEQEEILSKKDDYESFLEEKSKLLSQLDIEEDKQIKLQESLSKSKIIEKQKILKEAKELSEEIKQLNFNLGQIPKQGDEIQKDYNRYEEMEEEKNYILYRKQDNKLEFLKRDHKSYKEKSFKNHILLLIAVTITIVLFLMNKLVLALGLNLIVIYLLLDISKVKKQINKIKSEITNSEKDEKDKKDQIMEKEDLQKKLLEKYKVSNKIEFKNLLSKTQREFDIKEGAVNGIRMKESLLKRILLDNTIEGLEEELRGKEFNIDEDIDGELIFKKIDQSKDEISSLRIKLTEVETNFNILEKDISKLVQIEEEIYRKEQHKDELDSKLESLDLAMSTIEELSKNIHSQFAPGINKRVSGIIEKITNGKYNNMRVDESLAITVENPITKELIDINSLSGGTIDQLYFSLRFGIINSIGENKLPLILDDCFIQYDDSRLRNIIKFLSEVSEERQIILFSCHNREEKIMKRLGIDYNFINLT